MKRVLAALLLIALLLPAAAHAAKARNIQTSDDSKWHAQHLQQHINFRDGKCTGNYVKVRTAPHSEEGYGHLEQADQFLLLDVEDGYAKIRVICAGRYSPDSHDGLTGWVNADYIDCPCSESEYWTYPTASLKPTEPFIPSAPTYPNKPAQTMTSLPAQWIHSSGAGGWRTTMTLFSDGSFFGEYTDSEMGSIGEGYPYGTVYESRFSGRFSSTAQISTTAYRMTVENFSVDGAIGRSNISDGIRYVTCKPAGMGQGDTFILYLPGTPVSSLPEDSFFWLHGEVGEYLNVHFLYNSTQERGFVPY